MKEHFLIELAYFIAPSNIESPTFSKCKLGDDTSEASNIKISKNDYQNARFKRN